MRRTVLKAMLAAPCAWAQPAGFPNRSLRMIVPFAAGGAADVVARLMAQGMSEALGQQVVVENRGGSGGVLGSEAALAAPADGYSFAFHTLSSAVINAGLYRNLSFDVRQAFLPVSLVGVLPNVILVNGRFPARNLAELIALLRANPGKYTYASSGNGTITHLSAQLLMTMIGAQALHVPTADSDRVWQGIQAGVQAAVQSLSPVARQQRVYFEVSPAPYGASESSFMGETLSRMGVGNILPASMGPFPQVNPEWVVQARPDVIMAGDSSRASMLQRPGWSRLPAMQGQRLCVFKQGDSDMLVRAGPRMAEGAQLMADCLNRAAAQTDIGEKR